MASINFVLLVGRIGTIEIKSFDNRELAQISIATNSGYKSKDGEWKETTEWHRCIFAIPQIVERAKSLRKGDMIEVRGSIRTNSWNDKEGKKHEIKEIAVTSFSTFFKAVMKDSEVQEAKVDLKELDSDGLPF